MVTKKELIDIKRLVKAFLDSVQGLKHALLTERAFQQEVILYGLLLIPLYFLPLSPSMKLFLFFCNTLVLILELVNSAIESLADLATEDFHPLAKQAKDMSSAAVMLCLIVCICSWLWAICSLLLKA